MHTRLGSILLTALLTYCLNGLSQSVPNPTDTSYVMDLLKKAESIERKQAPTALTYYQKAYAFSKKINFTKGYFESVRLMAFLLNNLGRHDEARKLGQDALLKAGQDTSKRNLVISYFVLASTDMLTGKLKESIPYYQQAAHYNQLLGRLDNVAVINQNLGYIYEFQRMYPQALAYYRKSLAYNIRHPEDRRSIAIDYFSIATVLDKEEKVDESRAYFRNVLQWTDQQNDLDMMVRVYNNLSNQFTMHGSLDSGLYYGHRALAMNRRLGNDRHEERLLTVLAQAYNRMGNFTQAKTLLDRSYAIATRDSFGLAEFRNIYREYYYAYKGLHQYKKALFWSDSHDTVDSLLNNEETQERLVDYERKLRQAESRQKLTEKQQQIDRLQQEHQRQNLWLLIAGLVLLSAVGGLIFAYLYTRQRQRTANNALLAAQRERELAVVQSELQGQQKERLRISKEMHDDLGASLTAIGLLSEVVKTRMGPDTTPEVEKISSISSDMVTAMNEIIWSLNTKNDSLNGLIAYTRAYASEFIDNTSLYLRTEVGESPLEIPMRGTDRRNVFLTVKEALNNVVKHAQATEVTLRIKPETGQLAIDVCDNGRGFVPTEKAKLRNGLTNMQNRITESGGTCEISSSPTGTCVKITYPYPPVPAGKILQT